MLVMSLLQQEQWCIYESALLYSDGRPIGNLSAPFKFIGQGSVWGIPLPIVIFLFIAVVSYILLNADLIIMDESTSAITAKEVEQLFDIIASLKVRGVSIIYISHKMDEIFRICDDITVFRDGQFIGTKAASEFDQESLIQMMVGREIKQLCHKEEDEIGEERSRYCHA